MSKLRKNILRGSVFLPGLFLGVTAFAQTVTTTPVTPGVPTTAVGGDWVLNALLLLAGLILISIGTVMFRQKRPMY